MHSIPYGDWTHKEPTKHVHGQGMCADVLAEHPGMEVFAGERDLPRNEGLRGSSTTPKLLVLRSEALLCKVVAGSLGGATHRLYDVWHAQVCLSMTFILKPKNRTEGISMKQSHLSLFARKNFFKSVILVFLMAATLGAVELNSPDGNIQITIDLQDAKDGQENCLYWSISYRNKPILMDSRLGLVLKGIPNLDQGFTIVNTSRTNNDTTWEPIYGERCEIRDFYNQLIIHVQDRQTPPRKLQLKIRAYNEGAAFCYTIPRQDALRDIVIESEDTQFRFHDNHPVWAVYSAQGRYEKTTLDQIRPNCERPLTIKISDDLYVAIAEARLVDYARMRLKPVKSQTHTLVSMLAGEVKVTAPYTTPWRVILIGDSPEQLLERNYLMLNLNEPCAIKDTSWIKPGKVIREVSLTTAGGKACVDFAVKHGLQYIEYDAGWYGHEYDDKSDATTINVDPRRSKGPLDLHEVIRYAKEKGIGVWVYVNRRALDKQLDTILPLYKKWGIKGVKYGFVQVGSQKWTTWLHEAIRKAAENQLMVDVHDEYRPTGFERTYPNFLTAEGIGGNETMPPAEQNLTYPFTRYLCGPADYTICWYSNRVKNTRAHQLAASVVNYSPLQFLFWYDRPQMYQGEPEVEFFQHISTTWDETRVLHGAIGEYITVARRKGSEWFVGSMNAIRQRKLKIPLSFLKPGQKYQAHIYNDSSPEGNNRTGVSIRRIEVDSMSTITADMARNGGQAIRLVPLGDENDPVSTKPAIQIDTDYPGGNILVEKIWDDTVYIKPDVRDTRDWWFYWNFRVRGAADKILTFQFVGKNAIGVRGPAVSTDGGQTWAWLGKKTVKNNSFSYTFPDTARDVRFCFAIPYTQTNLKQFLKSYDKHPHLSVNELCKTRKGRSTQRLHLGKLDGEPKYRILMTCRHHACEMTASFVLEGALEVMLSDSDAGRWFQNNVEVTAIPFMDKDGVEDGDQGKNRIPHDHNRDYMGESIYPSVRALREFAHRWSDGKLNVAVDLHCPYVSGPNNEMIYQVGNKDPQLWREQTKLAVILESIQTGPLPYKASDNLPFGKAWNTGSYFGKYKSFRLWAQELPGMKLPTTFEIPYANAHGKSITATSARAFGRDLALALQQYLQQLD